MDLSAKLVGEIAESVLNNQNYRFIRVDRIL